MRTFVDTNIWVYANDASDPAKRTRARQVLAADPAGLWTSPQVMGELYVTLTRKLPKPLDAEDAMAIVKGLARLKVVPLDAAQVQDAMDIAQRHRVSYWDALVLAASRSAGCELLLTEDLAQGAIVAGVRIENPFARGDSRLGEAAAPYAASSDAWGDTSLRAALAAYETVCRDAGMKPNAVHSYWDYARRFLDWREGLYPRGAEGRPVVRRTVRVADLFEDVAAYERALVAMGLQRSAIDTYVRHARFFVRWLGGGFQPGGRLRR